MLYTIVNSTTQCGENRHTDIANFSTQKKIIRLFGDFHYMYREICQTDLSEFHSIVWEKSPEVSTKYILLCSMAIIAIFL